MPQGHRGQIRRIEMQPGEKANMPMKESLAHAEHWPVTTLAVGVVDAVSNQVVHGAAEAILEWASVTKLLTALATLVAVDEETVALDDEVGPPGSTLRHLLAHASGLGTDTRDVLADAGTRRIYSNTGFELAADHVSARADMDFIHYLDQAVLQPLGMTETSIMGSPAWGARGPLTDLLKLGAELLMPTIVSPVTLRNACTVALPGLPGVLPGFGEQDPNDWGLGFELRGEKSPHWTGTTNSSRTFGHFGRAGGFLWVDPVERLACACLTDRTFGPWAARAWPVFNDAVLDAWRLGGRSIA